MPVTGMKGDNQRYPVSSRCYDNKMTRAIQPLCAIPESIYTSKLCNSVPSQRTKPDRARIPRLGIVWLYYTYPTVTSAVKQTSPQQLKDE